MASDLDIARSVTLRPIAEISERAGIPASALLPYGRYKAKIDFDFIDSVRDRPDGALVLVTGINPTPAGEGKTTTTIGLADALRAGGRTAIVCLREPSLGPCFGVKGGATGGGWAQVAPMDEINLHFTGDFHAITSANNLLAALLDNHLYWGNPLGIDPRRVTWRRALDMNDRVLRQMVVGLGGTGNGVPREDGFDITVASEVMAVFCLASDLADLQARLGRMIVATRKGAAPVTAADLKAVGAMAALLRDALMPNLVQTLAATPALVHGGPFANIAHGCNSVMATKLGLKLADIVVTEAGFGADLGGEKFFDIKCRSAGLRPACAVIVATARALKMHGGVAKAELGRENPGAVTKGVANLRRHIENVKKFGVPVVVAVNRFSQDTDAELSALRDAVGDLAPVQLCTHWADGAAGAAGLARVVENLVAAGTADFRPLYPSAMPLADKIATIAREIYRAADVTLPDTARKKLDDFEAGGFGDVPVCIAKTQYSFSADPKRLGAPEGHVLPVRDVRLSAGAGFVVALAGDVMTMPGLPRVPSAEAIGLGDGGLIEGLF
jgi:formate--tetrahydrofolate ligase